MPVVLVVCVIIGCHSIHASENEPAPTFGQVVNQGLKFAGTATTNSKFIIASTFLADHAEDSIIGKSAVETAGYVFDVTNGDLSKVDYKNAGEHFIINYGIRRAGLALNKRGYTFDPIVNACDQLPVGVGVVVNPVVKPIIQTVTHPEALTLVTLYTLNNFVIPYLESGKK